jgi:hypothetical protein
LEPEFLNYEYAGHQVGLKDPGSKNFSFLAFMGLAVCVAKILSYNGTCKGDPLRHKAYSFQFNFQLIHDYD